MPSAKARDLSDAVWPATRAAEALHALAGASGLPVASGQAGGFPKNLAPEHLAAWLEGAAERAGLQLDQVFVSLTEIDELLRQGGPALLRLPSLDESPFLALVRSTRSAIEVLGPDLRHYRVDPATIAALIRAPFEAPARPEVDRALDRLELTASARTRAMAMMLADRLTSARFRGCWLVRLPPGSSVAREARDAGLPSRLATLVLAHLAQYGLFILSWWLLGRAVLSGTVDQGWLFGWVLLLVSLVPLRLVATWSQGLAAIATGAWLRRRLLRGAFRIDRQEVRHKGAGQLFGLVMEASAIDALALSGGLAAAFSLVELAVASGVLYVAAGLGPLFLIAAWTALLGMLAWHYFRRRRAWTGERFGMTHRLLECMLGHRTRLVQQSEDERHEDEDDSLDRYLNQGHAMDRAGLWLTALMPRGWLVLALAALTPAMAGGRSSGQVAVAIGAVLLAYRSLQRLSGGLSNIAGALVAGASVAHLAKAAQMREAAALTPALPLRTDEHTAVSADGIVAKARDLTFRYRPQGEPVLQGCSLTIERRARLLLEGPSGSGKTTFGAILAGLQTPDSGVLLVGGLDRAALGSSGWRARVTMAPQAHDNYLVGASLAFNLLMGRRWPAERADLREAETVCRELGLGDLLDRLPGGLHQLVGETGWQLSQGERSRVFLARALLQRPDLLVLDESFSALDAENVDRAIRCVTNRAPAVLAIAHP